MRGCGLLPRATSGGAEQMNGTVQHEWQNGLSQIKFLQQSLPLLIRESGLFMRDGLDGRPCCAPAVLKRMTSRQCDLGGSAQPCSEWMLLKRETQPAWGHLPLHLLTHEQRTMPTECLHLPDPAGHSGDDSEATVRGSRDDEVFLARLTLSSSQSVSWPP